MLYRWRALLDRGEALDVVCLLHGHILSPCFWRRSAALAKALAKAGAGLGRAVITNDCVARTISHGVECTISLRQRLQVLVILWKPRRTISHGAVCRISHGVEGGTLKLSDDTDWISSLVFCLDRRLAQLRMFADRRISSRLNLDHKCRNRNNLPAITDNGDP